MRSIKEKHKFNANFGKLVTENVREEIIKDGKEKFNLLEDINFQIAMKSFDQYNDIIATMYDNLDIYNYSEIENMRQSELRFDLKESEEAIRYLQLIMTLVLEQLKKYENDTEANRYAPIKECIDLLTYGEIKEDKC